MILKVLCQQEQLFPHFFRKSLVHEKQETFSKMFDIYFYYMLCILKKYRNLFI